MTHARCPAFHATIYIAGSMQTIEETCREFCLKGLCVSIMPATFVFTGGAESGAAITLINYARFPKEPEAIVQDALELTHALLFSCCQRSASVVTPTDSYFIQNDNIVVPR